MERSDSRGGLTRILRSLSSGRPKAGPVAQSGYQAAAKEAAHGIDFVWNSKISSFRQNPHLTALLVLLYRPPLGHGLPCPGGRRGGESRGGSWTLARMEKRSAPLALPGFEAALGL